MDKLPESAASMDIEEVFRILREFYTEAEINTWLYAPHDLLGGETAFNLMQRGDTYKVLDMLRLLEDDVYL